MVWVWLWWPYWLWWPTSSSSELTATAYLFSIGTVSVFHSEIKCPRGVLFNPFSSRFQSNRCDSFFCLSRRMLTLCFLFLSFFYSLLFLLHSPFYLFLSTSSRSFVRYRVRFSLLLPNCCDSGCSRWVAVPTPNVPFLLPF